MTLTAEEVYERLTEAVDAAGLTLDPDADDLLERAAQALAKHATESDDDRGPNAQYQMYTRAGNDAVAGMLAHAFDLVKSTAPRSYRQALKNAVREGQAQVAKTHPEVHDTEPEWAIVDKVNTVLRANGMSTITREDIF